MEKSVSSQPVLYEEIPTTAATTIGVATLNIEKRLNAVNHAMVKSLHSKLRQWRKDPSISCVVIRGAGEKAFCAGGDCIDMYHSMVENPSLGNTHAQKFFSGEYSLFYSMHDYPKPLVCWGDGIVMGGGMGMMNSCSHRIVTEKSILAMPEVSIGLYPDVGASRFLENMPGRCGLFLGLTGSRVNAADATFLGLATHQLPSDTCATMLESLSQAPWTGNASLDHNLTSNCLKTLERTSPSPSTKESNIRKHYDLIQELCDCTTPLEFAENLKHSPPSGTWLETAYSNFFKGSPTTAHLTFELRRRSRNLSLADIFRLEYGVTMQCVVHPDFREGIRAVLIDKDGKPQWTPATLEEITPEWINGHFSPPCAGAINPMNHPHCARNNTEIQLF